MIDSAASLWSRLSKIGPRNYVLGFPKYEYLVHPTAYQYVILAARPGMFKSTLAWMWAMNLAISGRKVLWLGVEMGHETMLLWSLARLTGIPLRRLQAHGRMQISLDSSEISALAQQQEILSSLPIVKWSKRRIDLRELQAAVSQIQYDAIFLDYLGLVLAPGKEFDRIGVVSRFISEWTRENAAHFVALAQMNRGIERTEGGKPRPPNLSDLRGSGQLEADADVVAFLWRPGGTGPKVPQNEVQLRVEKNRDGPTGIVDLTVQPEVKIVSETWKDASDADVRSEEPDDKTP